MAFQALDLASNITIASLQDVNRPFAVHDVSGSYQNLYMTLAIISQGQNPDYYIGGDSPEIPFSRGYYATDRRFVNAYLDDLTIKDTVGNRVVQPNGNLILSMVNNVDAFRIGDVVQGGVDYRRKGQVVNIIAAGVIEIQPLAPLTAFLATDFAIGSITRVMFDSSAVVRSSGKTALTVTPRTDWNTISTIRDSHEWSLQNTNIASLVDNTKSVPEGMWFNAQIRFMARRMMQQIDRMLLSSQRAQNVSGPQGNQDFNGGLEWSLRNRGGFVQDLNNAMTRQQFENWLLEVSQRKTGGSTRRPWLVMGTAAQNRINSFGTGDYIRYQRSLVAGGNMLGTNFSVITVAGREFNLMVAEVLDNPELFPEVSTIPGVFGTIRSNDIYYIDADPLQTENGMGERPAIQMLHWSQDGSESGGSPFYAGFIKGMNAANVSESDIFAAAAQPIVTDVEGSAFHLMYKGGIDMITGKFSGKIGYLI